MDSKKINSLLTSIEKGSLTSAAAELGYTQSGLTHMMNSLEEELGLSLLVRSKVGVQLSPEGLELLPKMKKFAVAADELKREAERLRQRSSCSLRLGTYSSIARQWIPDMLSDFRLACPEAQVSLTMIGVEELYSAVRNGELDCAMVSYQPSLRQGLQWIELKDDELLAVLPESYALSGEALPVEEFEGADFLMPSMGFELDISPIFSFDGRSIIPRVRSTNLDDASIISMVEHGLGLSVLSSLVMAGSTAKVKAVPLEPHFYRRLGIIVSERASNDKTVRRFISCCRARVNSHT